jgi:hypothetical protein
MARAETYLRVLLKPNNDPDEYQHSFDGDPRYIGSYVVDVNGVNSSAMFQFDVVIGFRPNVDSEDPGVADQVVTDLANELLADPRVQEIRTLRRQDLLADEEAQGG